MTPDSTSGLYLEDLAVEQEFLSGEYPLDAEQIIAFASEYDPQPFHTDPAAAKNTFFQGHAASGWHTMAITMRLLVQSIPLAHGIIGINGTVSWPRPTRPGDVLHVKSRIVEIIPSRSKPGRAIVQIHSLTLNQADEVLLDFTAKVLVFRKEA
jgi:acyl dehydratase